METEILDYQFLGEDMSPSANANFERLMLALQGGPGAKLNDTLMKHHHLIPISAGSVGNHPALASKAPDKDAEILSRLIYFSVY